jgi:hypothetical protein
LGEICSNMLYITCKVGAETMSKANPNILTLSELAGFLGVHYLTARKYCSLGLLNDFGAYRLPSGYWRIPIEGAEKFKISLSSSAKPKQKQAKKAAKRPAPKR